METRLSLSFSVCMRVGGWFSRGTFIIGKRKIEDVSSTKV